MRYRRYRYLNELKSSGQTETFEGLEVPPGFALEVTSMVVVDRTTADKLLRIGVLDHTGTFKDFVVTDGTSAFACRLQGHAWIEEGERPAGKVTSATASDYCSFSVHGKLWPKEEVRAIDAEVQQASDMSD